MPLWFTLAIGAPFFGSFLGVLATRLPARGPVIAGRSRCESCGRTLSPRDLIPFLSWLILHGKCRYCGAPLGWLHPAIEAGSLVLVLWASTIVSGVVLLVTCVLGWTLLTLAITDWRHYLLPDPLVLFLLASGLIAIGAIDPDSLPAHVVGVVLGLVSFMLIASVYRYVRDRDGLGFGDAKLLAALGAWLSWEGLPTVVLLAAVLGLVFATVRALAVGNASWTERLPFGSFLAASAWLTWLYGPLTFA